MPKIIEQPRELILEVAKELLIEKGYDEFNIRDVAKSCGVAVGTIYNYFPNKKELTQQVIMEHWEGYFRIMQVIAATDDDIFQKLAKMYVELEQFVDRFRGFWMKAANVQEFHSVEKIKHRKDFVERQIKLLESVLIEEVNRADSQIHLPVDSYELANFIIHNLFIMVQMRRIEYKSFDQIIRKLLSK